MGIRLVYTVANFLFTFPFIVSISFSSPISFSFELPMSFSFIYPVCIFNLDSLSTKRSQSFSSSILFITSLGKNDIFNRRITFFSNMASYGGRGCLILRNDTHYFFGNRQNLNLSLHFLARSISFLRFTPDFDFCP